jgi:hypothetical protein
MIISEHRIKPREDMTALLAARRARVVIDRLPSIMRGRREDRVRAAPAVSCAMCTKKCAHEHTGSGGASRPSLRNGLTAYAVLSPETNSFCLRRFANWWRNSNPVGRLPPSRSLTPATGARTTRFCRTPQRCSSCARSIAHSPKAALRSLSRATLFASTAARTPRIVTTRTPLCMRRDGAKRAPFSANGKRIIFDGQSGRPKSR